MRGDLHEPLQAVWIGFGYDPMPRIRLVVIQTMACLAIGSVMMAQPSFAGDEGLSQEANYPTASVMAFQIGDWNSSRYHNLDDGHDNTVAFRAAQPMSLRGLCPWPA